MAEELLKHIRKPEPNELPTIEEVEERLERVLKIVFGEKFEKFVRRIDKGRWLILSSKFLHLPGIMISIHPHPVDQRRALFLMISRRIPLDSDEDIVEIMSNFEDLLVSVRLETVKREYNREKSARYLLLSAYCHVITFMQDEAWFLLLLGKILRVERAFFFEGEEEKPERREVEERISISYT